MPVIISGKEYLNLPESSAALGGLVAPRTLQRWHARGEGPVHTVIGGHRLISHDELVAWVDALAAADQDEMERRYRLREAGQTTSEENSDAIR